ncbi:hypothetical protein [Flavobacterium sp. 5]|uniref:hypothetical protein n=1 Tax=Flavobacterium sp. 5 TaxID=2035199 RepID=UPI000C2BA1D3|nr:hypothetical protein [Flavobacterium sp. 5]PKB16049.1 hypothetical protein CLU82_1164 [Flavobacterium sp. 5]
MKTEKSFIASLLAIAFFISCDSADKTNDNSAATTPADQVATDSKIDASIDDVSNIAEDQFSMQQNITSKSSTEMKSMLPACATTTWTLTNGTFTGTIDFGTEGCTLENGNVLKGKIILSFSGNFSTSEQTITYTLDGFYHNGIKIQGSKTITRSLKSTDLLATIHPVFACTIDMTVTFEDGSIYTRTGNRTRELVEGYDTKANWQDNVYLVTGSENTSKPNGDTWSNTITTPLRYEMTCKKPFPVSGTVLKVKNGVETLVDYGNGECDNLVLATTADITITIELKK